MRKVSKVASVHRVIRISRVVGPVAGEGVHAAFGDLVGLVG